MDLEFATGVVLAVMMGMMIGMQREMHYFYQNRGGMPGTRSFAIIALLGYLGAFFYPRYPVVLIVLAAAVALLLIVAFVMRVLAKKKQGTTSELAGIATFAVGILAYREMALAVFVAVIIVALLEVKAQLKTAREEIRKKEIRAAVLFLLMTFVILPVLPDEPIDPYKAINPYHIWLMVLLISAISFAGYLSNRFIGASRGLMLTGFVGGLASSTAVTITLSRKAKEEDAPVGALAAAIALACSTMFIRVVVLSFIVVPPLAQVIALPFLAGTLAGYGYIYYLYRTHGKQHVKTRLQFENPLELKEALKFGLLFGAVFAVTSMVQRWMGEAGVYLAAAGSGLTDVDAITLSLAQLVKQGETAVTVAATGVVIASAANSLTKLVISLVLGNARLAGYLGATLGIIVAVTLGVFGAMRL